MDKPRVTPNDFFLWVGAMVSLYGAVIAFVSLLFGYLNYAFPDPLEYFAPDPYASGVSYEMASLIVLAPLAILLFSLIQSAIGHDPSRADVWVRRWALYLTLSIAAATLVGDLITLIMYFFNGDVSVRFLLKVLVILLVAFGVFLHFLADLRGYWAANPGKCRLLGWALGALVVATIATGFFVIGTPWQARQYRLDEERVSDLKNIQWQVTYFWQAKQKLPAALADLTDATRSTTVPVDPSGASYEYRTTGPHSFELCAVFSAPTQAGRHAQPRGVVTISDPAPELDDWYHGAGRTCFARTIDPAFYPPLNKKPPQ